MDGHRLWANGPMRPAILGCGRTRNSIHPPREINLVLGRLGLSSLAWPGARSLHDALDRPAVLLGWNSPIFLVVEHLPGSGRAVATVEDLEVSIGDHRGFRVRMCSAQMMQDRGLSPLYDHMVLVAEVDGHEYLVDVANGESVRTPLRLDSKEISKSPEGKTYRLGEFYGIPALEVQESNEQEWRPRFVFIPAACRLEEFADRCHFHQTSKKSQFTRQPLVTLALPEGRVTLAGRTLTVTHARSSVTARELNTDAEYKACLHAQFGIHL